jgi:hypothetical protein
VIVRVRAPSAGNVVTEGLRVLRARLDQGRGVLAIWGPVRWQPEGEAVEMVDEIFEIEMQHVEKRISALTELRRVLEEVDPAGDVFSDGKPRPGAARPLAATAGRATGGPEKASWRQDGGTCRSCIPRNWPKRGPALTRTRRETTLAIPPELRGDDLEQRTHAGPR